MIANIEHKNNSDIDKIVKILLLYKKLINRAISYSTFKTKIAFIKLRKVFTNAKIFYYFDIKNFIQSQTNTSSYAIGKFPSFLTKT